MSPRWAFFYGVVVGLIVGMAFGMVLVKPAHAQSPTPLGEIKRDPYVTAVPDPAPAPKAKPVPKPDPRDTDQAQSDEPYPPPRRVTLWWQSLAPGWFACSVDPYGQRVCGNGYWVRVQH